MNKWKALILVSLLVGEAGPLLADAIFSGPDGTGTGGSAVLATYWTDSRYQMVIGRDEFSGASGTLTGVSLKLWAPFEEAINNVTVRGCFLDPEEWAPLTGGQYINTGLVTLADYGWLPVYNQEAGTGWWSISFFSGTVSTTSYATEDLLLDFCVDNDSTLPVSANFASIPAGAYPAARTITTNTNPEYNLLNAGYGNPSSFRPLVRLEGLNLSCVGSLYPGQLPTPLAADVLVPAGSVLRVFQGTSLFFKPELGIRVEGALQAMGTATSPIEFSGLSWEGLLFEADETEAASTLKHVRLTAVDNVATDGRGALCAYYHEVPLNLSHVEVADCLSPYGGGLFLGDIDLNVEDLWIHNCRAVNGGGGILAESLSDTLASIRIADCLAHQGGGLYINRGTSLWDRVCLSNNTADEGSAVYGSGCGDTQFRNCTFHGGSSTAATVELSAYNANQPAPVLFESCLFMPAAGVERAMHSTNVRTAFAWCSSPVGSANFVGDTFSPLLLEGNISYDGEYDTINWRPHRLESPLVDAGNPVLLDADLTRCDIGTGYWDQSAPVVTHLCDVPADQGHQLQLAWEASSMDLAQVNDDWFYSVWRLDSLFDVSRCAESLWLEDVSQFDPAQIGDTPIRVTAPEGHVWTFVSQVPATQVAEYGLIVPTLHDMLDGQAWESEVLVYWHHDTELAESATATAISVDNIAPDAPLALVAVPAGETIELSWNAVTTGTLDGVTLPERNGIVYHIYASENPWFDIEDAEYLGTVSEPRITLPVEENTRRFYKIVASDSQ